MSGATFTAWYTLVVFGIIILVILWAFLPKNKKRYDDIAKSVVDDDSTDLKDNASGRKQESNNNE
ncbi:CcoQ/FixQ family Cbb3-type cytochrome c oxidase assembly chaperone [Aliidiomarina taiwanensis]|uniref:CcoQ/FixQ family Cbb3-type cytochrome c oxidase assembly chaperone n=1 Tax=Aliidiomarina taiwanensis TaxID=946228 RepID=A0A432X9R5_9GAMM|nr:cbb3-type cytochrome c oxidase subunit 3 [Aliidiomarina taiwanensis]RUO44163.1 CcoQ/FixQ family Cbb3-type cytochrome c oxidase assembly chaperone [Aliidiomarina taiwanensis]